MSSPYLVTELAFPVPGAPAILGVTLESVVGASHIGDCVCVYAVSSDSRLFGCTFFKGKWFPWQPLAGVGYQADNLSPAANASGNAVVANDRNVWLFVVDKAGSLWCGIWDPTQPAWAWAQVLLPTTLALAQSRHGPITSVLGAAPTANGLTVTVKLQDGLVLIFIWDNTVRQWVGHRFPTNSQPVPLPPVAVLGWSHVSTDTDWRAWAFNTVFGYMQGELGAPAALGIAESVPGIAQYTSLPVDVSSYSWITILFWAQAHKVYCATTGNQTSS